MSGSIQCERYDSYSPLAGWHARSTVPRSPPHSLARLIRCSYAHITHSCVHRHVSVLGGCTSPIFTNQLHACDLYQILGCAYVASTRSSVRERPLEALANTGCLHSAYSAYLLQHRGSPYNYIAGCSGPQSQKTDDAMHHHALKQPRSGHHDYRQTSRNCSIRPLPATAAALLVKSKRRFPNE